MRGTHQLSPAGQQHKQQLQQRSTLLDDAELVTALLNQPCIATDQYVLTKLLQVSKEMRTEVAAQCSRQMPLVLHVQHAQQLHQLAHFLQRHPGLLNSLEIDTGFPKISTKMRRKSRPCGQKQSKHWQLPCGSEGCS
jgi:hypothetical protein